MKYLITILSFFICNYIYAQAIGGAAMYTSYTRPHYGVLVASSTLTGTQKAAVAHDTLSCETVRSRIVTSTWNSIASGYEPYQAKKLKQGVVITAYPTGSAQPFVVPGRIAGFTDTVNLIKAKYFTGSTLRANDSVTIFVDNEPTTAAFHFGSLIDYGAEMQVVYNIFHPLGIKVVNGGITTATGLKIKTYRYVLRKYGSFQADSVYAKSMLGSQVSAAKDSNSNAVQEAQANQIDTLASYKQYEDYTNMHFYEVLDQHTTAPDTNTIITPLIIRYQKEYLEQLFGQPCITNECGIDSPNTKAALVTSVMNNNLILGFQQVQYYSGDTGDNPSPLVNPTTGNILSQGSAYKTFIQPFLPQNSLP